MNLGICYILNGGCEEICILRLRENGSKCECDIGLKF